MHIYIKGTYLLWNVSRIEPPKVCDVLGIRDVNAVLITDPV